MGLKIGERMYLMDMDENTPIIFPKKIIYITNPYMYELFVLWDINLVFLQYYQNTIYIHNYGYVLAFL
jgi:hypothetical protein